MMDRGIKWKRKVTAHTFFRPEKSSVLFHYLMTDLELGSFHDSPSPMAVL